MSSARMSQLENSLLELGTEMYKLRHQVSQLNDFHEKFVGTIKGLKQILDDKGVISSEDFESAVELGEAINIEASSTYDPSVEQQNGWGKKFSH